MSGFSTRYPLGGIESHVMELCQAFTRECVAPAVLGMWSFGHPGESSLIDRLHDNGVETLQGAAWDAARPYRSFWNTVQKLTIQASSQRFDIIHSHNEFGDIAALLLARTYKARALVRTVHNEYEWKCRPLRRLLLTNLLLPLTFDQEIGISQSAADKLNRRPLSRLLRRHAIHIHNAIDPGRFANVQVERQEVFRRLGVKVPATYVIGTVGRLVEQKGVSFLVEAAAEVLRSEPGAVFLIVGTGSLEADLQEKAARLGISKRVIFSGPRNDVPEILACLDLFVSSSLWEGLPTVILEAMAIGRPIVATDIPGTRELVQDGETGWLVPVRQPVRMAEIIINALSDPQERALRAKKARNNLKNYSIQAVAEENILLYKKLLAIDFE